MVSLKLDNRKQPAERDPGVLVDSGLNTSHQPRGQTPSLGASKSTTRWLKEVIILLCSMLVHPQHEQFWAQSFKENGKALECIQRKTTKLVGRHVL